MYAYLTVLISLKTNSLYLDQWLIYPSFLSKNLTSGKMLPSWWMKSLAWWVASILDVQQATFNHSYTFNIVFFIKPSCVDQLLSLHIQLTKTSRDFGDIARRHLVSFFLFFLNLFCDIWDFHFLYFCVLH